MPGVRDRNLRSGDLHEELGLLLLKAVALVAPVPRQEDVGTDAFATLVRPEGSRRLLPDLSFLVQLKAASVRSVVYARGDEMAWIKSLEVPLFVGRVDLRAGRIELFTTQRLHQVLLETGHESVDLLLDQGSEDSTTAGVRRASLGPPVHTWSVTDIGGTDFLSQSFTVLRPHVASLRRNRALRGIQSQQILTWRTGEPPTENGEMILTGLQSDIADTVRDMAPHARRLMMELSMRKKYADFPVMLALFDLMRRWGADPDPGGWLTMMAGSLAGGPEIPAVDAIRYRHAFHPNYLDLRGLGVGDVELAAVPDDVEKLVLVDCPVTDTGVPHLVRLAGLTRLNLAGTKVTDAGVQALADLTNLQWICVHRTAVTPEGVARLRAARPDLDVMAESEPK